MTQKSSRSNNLLGRALRAGMVGIGSLALFAGMSSGCLDRPVAPANPNTTNIFVDQIIQTAVDKIDLLFMIDNSRSMADKQTILRQAVPQLLGRLINPLCVNPTTGALTNPGAGGCPNGTEQEFSPIDDIHIGIVTSSLGGHGADTCSPALMTFDPSEDDKAQLLPSVRQGIPQYNNAGFLVWDPSDKHTPPGEQNDQTLITNFGAQIQVTGEVGCGFEASLEAWYRFLIDPVPPSGVRKENNQAIVDRPNQLILQQRAAFLRPDSLVAVIMLTDENDCSTFDGGIAWLAGQGGTDDGGIFTLPRSTQICQSDANSPCCRSCSAIESGPPAGCQPKESDPGCNPGFHDEKSDPLNLRCWDQKRRYGVDFLYGVGRYVEGLTSLTVTDFTNTPVPNPLFMDLSGQNQPSRPQSLVFLAGIIGVPWQDIATDDTIGNPNDLKYMTADQINKTGRWDWILGTGNAPPLDALMFESPYDRTTLTGLNLNHPHPTANIGSLVGAGGPLRGHPINGNEYVPGPGTGPSRDDDLQYACIFPLNPSRQCTAAGCDCSNSDQGNQEGKVGKPLCQGNEQTHAKGYPGLRHLQVLRGIGIPNPGINNAIIASICPKITDPSNPAYGYNPAVAAIIERLKEQLGGKCLPRPLDVNEEGNVPCAVVEAIFTGGGCSCDQGANRGELLDEKAALIDPVRARLAGIGQCGGTTGRACEDFCLCEILPAAGQARDVCLSDPSAVNAGNNYGYCYVDPRGDPPLGTEELVTKCPESGKRKLQFIGQNTPAKGSVAFIACLGSTITDRGDSGL